MRQYLYSRFYGSTIGPQGGSALKTGVNRVDVHLRHESCPAQVEVTGSLVAGVPRVLIRAWQIVPPDQLLGEVSISGVRERVFFDAPFSEIFHDPGELARLAQEVVRAYYQDEDSRALDDAAESLRTFLGWD